jgi:hypothetical protein
MLLPKRQSVGWPAGKNWLEMDVKQRNIQAWTGKFSKILQRSELKAR